MVLYTPDAATALGSENAAQAKAGAWIANLNTCLSNSSLGITASLAHTQQVTQNFGQNGHSQALQYLGSDTTVMSLRDTHKADLVNIMIQGAANGAGTVGLGQVLMQAGGNQAASTTSVWHSGQDDSFSHEIGHNHGCGHDATQGGSKLNAESQGYHFTGSDGKGYRTVMAYGKTGFTTRTQYFSGPSIIYKGAATGVSGVADNAKTIGATNPKIESYR